MNFVFQIQKRQNPLIQFCRFYKISKDSILIKEIIEVVSEITIILNPHFSNVHS